MINVIGIVTLALVSQVIDSDFTGVKQKVAACSQEYTLAANQPISPEVEYIEIRKLNNTTSIAFMDGNPGPLGVADEIFHIDVFCKVDNASGEIILLAEPFERTFIDKNVPERTEYQEYYVGNDKAYFDLLLFKYGDGDSMALVDAAQYTNKKIYEYFLSVELKNEEVKQPPSIEDRLIGQWLTTTEVENKFELECPESINFAPDGYYVVLDFCVEPELEFEEPYIESGEWVIESKVLKLHNRTFYKNSSFLSSDDSLVIHFTLTNDELALHLPSKEIFREFERVKSKETD